MALTRHFKDTIQELILKKPGFKEAMLAQAMEQLLSGDFQVAKSLIKDYIHGTVSLQKLALKMDKNDKVVQRMLSPQGNPTSENLIALLKVLQDMNHITFEIIVKPQNPVEGLQRT